MRRSEIKRIKDDARYIFNIYRNDNSIEIRSMIDRKTNLPAEQEKFDRIYKKPATLEDLKQEITWNLNKDPDRFLVVWELAGWGKVYACDYAN